MVLSERLATRVPVVVLPEPWRSADLLIVLPTYQEAANLPVIVDALFNLPLTGLRVLVVDDNSPDGTGRIAEELAEFYGEGRMSVVHRPGKEGLGRAYIDGMSRAIAAGAEFVVQMDSDLSHGPEYLPGMLGKLLSANADVVIASGTSWAQAWALSGRGTGRCCPRSPTRTSGACSTLASGTSRRDT